MIAWDHQKMSMLDFEIVRYDEHVDNYFNLDSPGNVALICRLVNLKDKRDVVVATTHLANDDLYDYIKFA